MEAGRGKLVVCMEQEEEEEGEEEEVVGMGNMASCGRGERAGPRAPTKNSWLWARM